MNGVEKRWTKMNEDEATWKTIHAPQTTDQTKTRDLPQHRGVETTMAGVY